MKNLGHFPVPGDVRPVPHLPVMVRRGHHDDLPAGHPLYGWDQTTDTFQLWEVAEQLGQPFVRKAKFIGFIHPSPPGRKNRRLEPSTN